MRPPAESQAEHPRRQAAHGDVPDRPEEKSSYRCASEVTRLGAVSSGAPILAP
jgi:hypothetical protein